MSQFIIPPWERWLPVEDYVGYYEVSDYGRVRSLDRVVIYKTNIPHTHRGIILTPAVIDDYGHLVVSLNKRGVSATRYVHLLVLRAFKGPCPEGLEGCHNDGDASDNRVASLRYDTHSSNMQDAVRHGTYGRGYDPCRPHAPRRERIVFGPRRYKRGETIDHLARLNIRLAIRRP